MKEKKHIVGLDSMRGLAILMVFVYHLFESFFRGTIGFDTQGVLQYPTTYPESATYFFAFNMRLSIHLFFLVSGYIIHALYHHKVFTWDFTSKFCLKRYFRMAPAYYVSILIAVSGALFIDKIETIKVEDIIYHMLFIHNFFDEYSFSIQALYWTMGIEFQFYLLYALFRFLFKQRFKLSYFFIFFFLLSLGIRAYLYSPSDAEHLHWYLMDNTIVRFSDWLMGAILFEYRHTIFKIRFKLIIFVGLILLASYMDKFGLTSTLFVDFVASSGMLFLVAHVLQNKLEPPFLKFVGVMSYSFYLYHFMAYSMVDKLGMVLLGYERVASWERFGIFLLAIPISLGIGFMMYKLIEEPAMRFFKDKLK